MEQVSEIIGDTIRKCRQNRKLSQAELARKIKKSKSTLSKYENGEISVDIDTLYEIAEALDVSLSFFTEALTLRRVQTESERIPVPLPEFFQKKQVFMYYWDGRNNSVNRSVLTIGAQTENNANYYHAALYMNVKDYQEYYFCENPYIGHVEFHHVLTGIYMIHQNTELEHIQIIIPEDFAKTERKWGVFSGVSFRPLTPAILKVLFSKAPLKITPDLIAELKFSKADFKRMKTMNLFTIAQEF